MSASIASNAGKSPPHDGGIDSAGRDPLPSLTPRRWIAGVTTVLAVATTTFAMWQGIAAHNRIAKQSDLQAAASEAVHDAEQLQVAVLQCRRFEKDMFLNAGDPARVAGYRERWESAVAEAWQSALSLGRGLSKITDDCDRWTIDIDRYEAAVVSIVEQMGTADSGAAGIANRLLEPHKDQIRSLIDGITSVTAKARNSAPAQLVATEEMIARLRAQQWTLASAVGIASILAAFTWMWLLRGMTHRLGVAKIHAEETAFRLQAIFDADPECVKVVDADGRLVQMNAAGLSMIEADSSEQVIGKSLTHLVVEEYHDRFGQCFADAFAGGRGFLEFEMVSLKGTRRRLEQNVVGLPNK